MSWQMFKLDTSRRIIASADSFDATQQETEQGKD
jgi:hypothetical protein